MLRGPAGESIRRTVTIRPKKKAVFKIIEVNAQKGKHIAYDLKEIQGDRGPEYRLTVSNLKKEPGRYFDDIVLKTDRKIQPAISVRVTGDILAAKFIEIAPREINLVGLPGEQIQEQVKIVSLKKHPFKVLEVATKHGEDIKYKLEEVEEGEMPVYLLTVQSLRKEEGTFADIISLKTDSKIQPVIDIRVNGIVFGLDQKPYYEFYKDVIKQQQKVENSGRAK